MPELHRTTPTVDEMERMYLALDRDQTRELHGPTNREYAICIGCAHGYHGTHGAHAADCACPCHAKPVPPIETPRKQTDLREFYRDPVAFGLKLAGVR